MYSIILTVSASFCFYFWHKETISCRYRQEMWIKSLQQEIKVSSLSLSQTEQQGGC